jgi:putative phage-type endonuclease
MKTNLPIVHSCIQGSPEWIALRKNYFSASDCAAMMGVSPYETRDQLLRRYATGEDREVDAAAQKRFDAGHAAEEAFRPIAEKLIGESLYPAVLSREVEGLPLLASFDGLTMDNSIAFEHKLCGIALEEMIYESEDVTLPQYYWQLEQQLLVSGAQQVEFFATDGTEENAACATYASRPERREALVEGWKRFKTDLDNWKATAPVAAVVGVAPGSLPTLHIQVSGLVTASNLAEYKAAALATFDAIPLELETDQDFADADKSAKWCEEIEKSLKAAKAHAQSQMGSVDELFLAIDEIAEKARQTRLALSKKVDAQKQTIRDRIADCARAELQGIIDDCSKLAGVTLQAATIQPFYEAMKGKKTIDSLRNAIATPLTTLGANARALADRYADNRTAMMGAGLTHLFPDFASVGSKEPDDFAAQMQLRKSRADEAAAKQKLAEEEAARKKEEAERARQEAAAAAQKRAEEVAQSAPVTPTPSNVTPIAQPATVDVSRINAFLDSREWSSAAARNTARATLVEFVKFEMLQNAA